MFCISNGREFEMLISICLEIQSIFTFYYHLGGLVF